MPENEIANSHGDTKVQRLSVKISASPRHREKIKMKDSGIPWVGEIPEDWEIKKIKALGILQGGNGFPEELQGNLEAEIPFVKVKSLAEDPILKIGKDTISEEVRLNLKATIIPRNSIVFAKVGAALLLQRFRKLEFSTCIDNNMMAFIPSEEIIPNFFVYASSLFDFSLFVNPGTVPSVNQEQVGNVFIPFPDINIQKEIVDFLDTKTAEIDALIALQEKMIAELKSYKQSVITEAVTRGVPADIKNSREAAEAQSVPVKISASPRPCEKIKTKDSGIPWLGSIPAHWEVRPLKTCATINDDVLSENTPEDFVIKYIDIGSVSLTNGISRFEEMIFSESPSRARRKVKNGDVIISTVRTYLRAIAEVKNPEENWICSTGFAVVRAGEKLHSGFMKYALTSEYFVGDVIRYSSGLNYPTINTPELGSIKIFVPPQNEQRTISKYLDQKCAEIDSLISLKQQKITTFQNYKKSVIFEYVTGKKGV